MSQQRISKSSLLYLVSLVSIAVAVYIYFLKTEERYKSITSFESCVAAGYKVLTTYPEQCKIPGKVFTNPGQKKEVVTQALTSSSTKTYFDLEYLINGTKVTLGTGTEPFLPTQLGYVKDLNMDMLVDVVFIVEKKINEESSEYYLLLALGLHSGEFAPANGLLIDVLTTAVRPSNIYINKNNEIEVAHSCIEGHECFYKYRIVNDILKAL